MVLDEFEIFQRCALQKELSCGIAVAQCRAGRLAEQGILTAGRKDERICRDSFEMPAPFIEQERTAAAAFVQQRRMEGVPQSAPDQAGSLKAAHLHDHCRYDLLAC